MVAEDHGKKVAQDVAKVLLVVMKRQGGQAQFSPLMAAVAPHETPITRLQNYVLEHLDEAFSIERMASLATMSARHFTRVQNYVLEHLDEAFSIERMASLATMSARHFARVFAREVNMTPMEFLQSARIDLSLIHI